MSLAQRLAAARNGFSATLLALAMSVVPAYAEGGPQLLLPLVTALALASAAEVGEPARPRAPMRATAPGGGRFTLVPAQLHLPDAYAEEIDVTPPRFAAPLDGDRIVSFDLFRRARRGWMASVAYDEERRGPLPGSSDVLSLIAEYRF